MQWSDKVEKENNSGKITIARYSTVTFPQETYNDLPLVPHEEDAIFYGAVNYTISDVKGSRLSDFMALNQRSGRIKSINNNTNRSFLKNVKVVIA